MPRQESHALQSAFSNFTKTNDNSTSVTLEKKQKTQNLFPDRMFGLLQLRALSQMLLLHLPRGQRGSQNGLVLIEIKYHNFLCELYLSIRCFASVSAVLGL